MRFRRRSPRRKLTAAEKRLHAIEDRLGVRVSILTRGVAQAFERLYSSKELALLIDFIKTDLQPAIKDHEKAEEACDKISIKMRRASKKNPTSAKKKKPVATERV